MPWENWKEKDCKPHQVPALDCMQMGHINVQHTEAEGFWPVYPDSGLPWASWCLWCGSGISNEDISVEPD